MSWISADVWISRFDGDQELVKKKQKKKNIVKRIQGDR